METSSSGSCAKKSANSNRTLATGCGTPGFVERKKISALLQLGHEIERRERAERELIELKKELLELAQADPPISVREVA